MPESRRRRSKKPSRARRTAPQGLPVQVRFGARYLDGILTSESSGQAKGESVEVALHATELHRDPPDMTAPMQLYTRVDGVAKDPRYGGYLTELEAGKDCWWIVRSNNLAHLGDHLTGGITTKRVPPIELLWGVLRASRSWSPCRSPASSRLVSLRPDKLG